MVVKGVLFLIFLVIDIIALVLFSTLKRDGFIKVGEEVSINCTLNKNEYNLSINTDEEFVCRECDNVLKQELEELIDYTKIDKSINNNGSCY